LLEVEVRAHLIRHQGNIGNNGLGGDAVSGFEGKARVFKGLARFRSGLVWRRWLRWQAVFRELGAKSRRGVFGGGAGGEKRDVSFSPAGGRRAPRLLSRYSTTWV